MKVGTMIAVPVRTAGVVRGALVVDKLEVQALGGEQPALVQAFAGLVAEAMGQLRAAASREDVGTEFKAVYDVSRQIANLTDPVATSTTCRPTAPTASRRPPRSVGNQFYQLLLAAFLRPLPLQTSATAAAGLPSM